MFPSALPGRGARRATTAGSRSRSAATTTVRSASCPPSAARRSAARTPTSSPRSTQLAADGVTEVTLLGQNVNSYGRDLQLAARQAGDEAAKLRPLFADLLRDVGAVDGIRRVRYTSPHPKDMRPETFAAMAETAAVCEHLHYPLQSGSDRILALMHRGYTAERYLERLAEARRRSPDLAVSTDIIVGFPGETEDDFERTLEVAAAAEYDYAYTFVFSPRPGTEAAEMEADFVDPAVAGERFERLRVVVERSALAKHEARVGRIEEVLVEGPSKKDPAVTIRPHPAEQARALRRRPARSAPGSYATVEVTRAAPHHLDRRLRRARRRRPPHGAHSRSIAVSTPGSERWPKNSTTTDWPSTGPASTTSTPRSSICSPSGSRSRRRSGATRRTAHLAPADPGP